MRKAYPSNLTRDQFAFIAAKLPADSARVRSVPWGKRNGTYWPALSPSTALGAASKGVVTERATNT
jgi:hypothetical protein